jgi:putative membrane protein
VVVASLLMWMPVIGPIEEFRIGVPGKMIYLFLQSVVPTVPAAWLTFAEGSVYDAYETPIRLWGISVTSDQQLAGAVMKLVGGMYLWAIVIYIFATQFAKGFGTQQDLRRPAEPPLTTEDVERAFAASTPVVEDH